MLWQCLDAVFGGDCWGDAKLTLPLAVAANSGMVTFQKYLSGSNGAECFGKQSCLQKEPLAHISLGCRKILALAVEDDFLSQLMEIIGLLKQSTGGGALASFCDARKINICCFSHSSRNIQQFQPADCTAVVDIRISWNY